MEEKRDKRIGKSGHLWLSARRKKRKATAAIAYQQERKKRRLEEISTFPEEVTWTLTSSGNENDDSSAPGTSQTESGIFNLITQKELMHEAAASQHTEENLGQHNHADLEHECDVSEDEVLSTKLKTMSKNIPEVEEVLQEDGIHTKTYAVLKQLSPIFVNSLEAQDYETNTENLHSLDHLSVTSITSHGQVSNTDSDELGYLRESACNYEEDSNIKSSDKTEMCPTTTTETDFVLEGHRIVDIGYVLMKLVELGNHNAAFGCSLNNMKVFKEIRRGLSSVVLFRCNMCNGQFSLHTHDPGTSSTHMDINARAVAEVMSIGGGFSHLEELCATIGIPCMSSKTYSKVHNNVSNGWEKAALGEMRKAVEEEINLAIKRGDVDENGIPLLTVVVDGCWSKRSYRTQYNALSGVAAIVGFFTKKVLFMAVRNKFCFVCARAQNANDIPSHTCYRNWTGSSSSMESSIIVEGFKLSEPIYNVKYSKMIADGDSSCYKKILEARPYQNTTVEKIECRNHLLRNYCNKLRTLSEQTKIGPPFLRKIISQKVLKLRGAVTEAIKHRKKEDKPIAQKFFALREDILNGPSHVFGEHEKCSSLQYFCPGPKVGEKNLVPEMKNCGLYDNIMKAVHYLTQHSRSLIYDVDSNAVEQLNSIIAKYVGGKRINYAMKRSYQARCSAAVVSHNTRKPHYVLHKTMCDGISPNKFVKKLETSRSKIRENANMKKKHFKRALISNKQTKSKYQQIGDSDYGEHSEKTDMAPDVYEAQKELHFKSLEKTDIERREIERGTLLQAGSGEWLERRRKMLTASKFGRICRRRPTTSCRSLVKNIIYSPDILNVPSLSYGRKYESTAIQQLEKQENISVQPCGLFIDKDLPFLGATPDGLIEKDGLVEIKCPSSAAGMEPNQAVLQGKIRYLTCNMGTNEITGLKKNHDYFFQIQGQLHITNRKFCLLAIWTSKDHPVKVTRVERDDLFWKNKMQQQLVQFYNDCLVPELVDPRYTRNMEIRDVASSCKQKKTRKSKLKSENSVLEVSDM